VVAAKAKVNLVLAFIMGRPTGDVFQWHGTIDGKAGGTASSVSVCGGERLTALLR
jgi:hypothetical protein